MENWQLDYTPLDLSVLVSSLKFVAFYRRKLRYTCTPVFSRGIIKIMRFSEKKKKVHTKSIDHQKMKMVRPLLAKSWGITTPLTCWKVVLLQVVSLQLELMINSIQKTRTIFYRTKSIRFRTEVNSPHCLNWNRFVVHRKSKGKNYKGNLWRNRATEGT